MWTGNWKSYAFYGTVTFVMRLSDLEDHFGELLPKFWHIFHIPETGEVTHFRFSRQVNGKY